MLWTSARAERLLLIEKQGLVNDVNEAVKAVEKIPEISRKACRQRVEEHFSLDIMVENYEKVYNKIFQHEALKSDVILD